MDEMKMDETKISPTRLAVLQRIEEYERKGLFDQPVEDDPPSKELKPEDVDYLQKKFSTRLKTKIANFIGDRYFGGQIKKNEVIVEGICGEEYLQALKIRENKQGAIITCNHFAPVDNYILFHCIRKYLKDGLLYKIIREGNYTSFPGLFGFLMRYCNTVPLSSNRRTMMNMLSAVNTLLKRGETVLVYPEQNMWSNYRKPRPFKVGGFKMAYRAGVPVIPAFITMTDDPERKDGDGLPLQRHTVHIMPPVYPDLSLGEKAGAEKMREETYALYKAKYEEVYKQPLVFSTQDRE